MANYVFDFVSGTVLATCLGAVFAAFIATLAGAGPETIASVCLLVIKVLGFVGIVSGIGVAMFDGLPTYQKRRAAFD
ncbi:MAG: hypothetical protein IBJ15_04995 [Alphaproteobacteria bacterium]|nr:hypothetical protein [Alphaproteobacteria bacterium]